MNKVQLIGNLTKDIELKNTTNGKVVGKGSIATNRSYIDQAGQKQTITQFHNFVVWNKQAETLAKWTKKGNKIYLEGEITYRDYTGQDGIKKYFTEIVISGFEFLPNGQRPAGDRDERDQSNGNPHVASREEDWGNQDDVIEDEEEIRVENIPF